MFSILLETTVAHDRTADVMKYTSDTNQNVSAFFTVFFPQTFRRELQEDWLL